MIKRKLKSLLHRIKTFNPVEYYSDALMLLLIMAIIPCAIVLGGCTRSIPVIPSIYVFRIYRFPLEVRVGMFSNCARSRLMGESWFCGKRALDLERSLEPGTEMLSILRLANALRTSLVFPYPIIVTIILDIIAIWMLSKFPRWIEEVHETFGTLQVLPIPSNTGLISTFNVMFVATLFLIVSLLWQVTASNGARAIAVNAGFQGESSRITRILIGLGVALFGLTALLMLRFYLQTKFIVDGVEEAMARDELASERRRVD